MKFNIIIISIFLYSIKIFASNNPNYADLKLNDTLKLINKNSDFLTHLYFFSDLSSCFVCNVNINKLYEQYNSICEFDVFINNATQDEISTIKKQFNGKINIIADEFGIYKEYYKIKYQPLLLVLGNNGNVCGWDNIKSLSLNIDSIIGSNKQKLDNTKKVQNINLKEIKRIKIKSEGNDLLTSLFRDCIYNIKDNSYVLANMRLPELILIDSNGNVRNIIGLYYYKNNQIELVQDITWAKQDSSVFIYGSNNKSGAYQIFNLTSDTIEKYHSFNSFSINTKAYEGYNATFITGKQSFINSIWFVAQRENEKMNYFDSIGKICDLDGKINTMFDKPDSDYINNKRSSAFSNLFYYISDNIYSIQNCSNKLKQWNLSGNLIKSFNLDFGKNYRKVTGDFIDLNSDESLRQYWNSVSTSEKLLIDKVSGNIIISFRNETYPEAIYDFMSNDVKMEVFINVYNNVGEKLNLHEIILPKGTIPFYFNNDYIFTSEMNKNKLEIAIYQFNR